MEVFDYRRDVRNTFVSSQMRSRFLRMEPGQQADLHSHDLGHEIFLILEGRARFEISGETADLGPGQACFARTHEPHRVSVIGDEPMTMYLSVTPHVQPTHTGRTEEGDRLPVRFQPSSAYDVEEDPAPVEDLVNGFVSLAEELASAATTAAGEQRQAGARLREALAAGDEEAAGHQREAMWLALRGVVDKLHETADQWNRLAPRAGKTG